MPRRSHTGTLSQATHARFNVLMASLILATLSAGSAPCDWAGEGLVQKPGVAGCVTTSGSNGCAAGRALAEVIASAVSPDGDNVYVVSFTGSFTGSSLAVFDRDFF